MIKDKNLELIKSKYKVFNESISYVNNDIIFMMSTSGIKQLMMSGELMNMFEGKIIKIDYDYYKIAPLSRYNASALRKLFSCLSPTRVLDKKRSVSFTDPLFIGLNTLFKLGRQFDTYLIVNRLSINDLYDYSISLEDILDNLTYKVFENGYKDGYSLIIKDVTRIEEIKYLIDLKIKSISFDLSIFVKDINDYASKQSITNEFKESYKGMDLDYLNNEIVFDDESLLQLSYRYDEGIKEINNVYNKELNKSQVDFEISLEKIISDFSSRDLLYIINELYKREIVFDSIKLPKNYNITKNDQLIANNYKIKFSIDIDSLELEKIEKLSLISGEFFSIDYNFELYYSLLKFASTYDLQLFKEIVFYSIKEKIKRNEKFKIKTIQNPYYKNDKTYIDYFNNPEFIDLIKSTYLATLSYKIDTGYRFKDRLVLLYRKIKSQYQKELYKKIEIDLNTIYKNI